MFANCPHCSAELDQGDCPSCNPHRLQDGDRVLLEDGRIATIRRAGWYTARFSDHSPRLLAKLRPAPPPDTSPPKKAPPANQLTLF